MHAYCVRGEENEQGRRPLRMGRFRMLAAEFGAVGMRSACPPD